jgi:hypothetical protein
VKRATRRALLFGAVAAIAATIAIQWLWTTDEERVVASLDALQEGFEQRDVDRIEPWLLPDAKLVATVPGIPRGKPLLEGLRVALGSFARLRISRNDPEISLRRGADVASEPGAGADDAVEATVVVTGTIFVEVRDVGGGPFAFAVTALFVKQPGGRFLLARVEQFRAEPGVR